MTNAEWRALIEALLDGRLSPEAFQRRFLEAWRDERDRLGGPSHPAIANFFSVVEAFDPDPENASRYDSDEQELREAARLALRELREDTRPQRTFDRARAREDMRRFQARVGQLAGIGCLMALGWVVLAVLQINYVIEQVNAQLNIGTWLSAILGFFLAFVPVVGNIVAFFGAKDVGGWPAWVAALVFFVLPAAAVFYGGWRWRGWRRR